MTIFFTSTPDKANITLDDNLIELLISSTGRTNMNGISFLKSLCPSNMIESLYYVYYQPYSNLEELGGIFIINDQNIINQVLTAIGETV